jgi:hypothetical protein
MEFSSQEGVAVKTLMRNLWMLLLAIALGILPVWTTAAEKSDANSLFKKRCSLCHPTDRSLSKTKTGKEWKQTVARMKGYAGDRISAQDAEIIAQYLTEIRGK